jgi:hypothetical protein
MGVRAGLALVLGIALGLGCNAISGLGDFSVPPGGSGSPAGTGGGGGGPPGGCDADSDCPAGVDLCAAPACESGNCTARAIEAGEPSWQQTKGDCRVVVCDASGQTESQSDEDDLPDDGQDCTLDLCTSGVPSNPPEDAGTACAQTGGAVCNGMGECVECVDDGDCTDGTCDAEQCVPTTCTDSAKNALETDVDCGGPDCAPCGADKACAMPSDCASGVCTNSVCQAPTCSDGVENGSETDVDCGGSSGCAPCGDGLGCLNGSDCASEVCVAGACQAPTCADGVSNGSETDVDCGGSGCVGCGVGLACNGDGDCSTMVCMGTCQNGLIIQIEGHAPVGVPCTVGDYQCQAQWVCNKVTGYTCVHQAQECCGSYLGSWYPPDGASGGYEFNFAGGYDFCPEAGDYGNICACNQNQMNVYGLASNHQYCGVGHWQRQ